MTIILFILQNNQTAELLGSEQDSRLPDPTVLLHVVDVGHGLAVLVELSKDHQHGNIQWSGIV